MPSRDRPVLTKYKRMRALEEAVVDALADIVADEAVDAVAASFGIPERGEALYDHQDYPTLLDLALHEPAPGVDPAQTLVEMHLQRTKPEAGSDEAAVLSAMVGSRVTLLRLGKRDPGVGLRVDDLLYGRELFLADPELSKEKSRGEIVILTRLLPFDEFVMTPCTSYVDFEPTLARMLATGLPKEAGVPMTERYAAPEAKRALERDLTRMALSSVDSVRKALVIRFGS